MGKADAESMFASARFLSLGILHGAHPLVRTVARRESISRPGARAAYPPGGEEGQRLFIRTLRAASRVCVLTPERRSAMQAFAVCWVWSALN
jgi:hypothetical protein